MVRIGVANIGQTRAMYNISAGGSLRYNRWRACLETTPQLSAAIWGRCRIQRQRREDIGLQQEMHNVTSSTPLTNSGYLKLEFGQLSLTSGSMSTGVVVALQEYSVVLLVRVTRARLQGKVVHCCPSIDLRGDRKRRGCSERGKGPEPRVSRLRYSVFAMTSTRVANTRLLLRGAL